MVGHNRGKLGKEKEQEMKTTGGKNDSAEQVKTTEVWYQDVEDSNLWFGEHGVIVNTVALEEREFYYDIIRVAHHPNYANQNRSVHA
jgi:hypothetical protein